MFKSKISTFRLKTLKSKGRKIWDNYKGSSDENSILGFPKWKNKLYGVLSKPELNFDLKLFALTELGKLELEFGPNKDNRICAFFSHSIATSEHPGEDAEIINVVGSLPTLICAYGEMLNKFQLISSFRKVPLKNILKLNGVVVRAFISRLLFLSPKSNIKKMSKEEINVSTTLTHQSIVLSSCIEDSSFVPKCTTSLMEFASYRDSEEAFLQILNFYLVQFKQYYLQRKENYSNISRDAFSALLDSLVANSCLYSLDYLKSLSDFCSEPKLKRELNEAILSLSQMCVIDGNFQTYVN